ncbi:MAG TPA: hypothetical protein VFA55_00245 [Candidatus Kapabacteria bacterium]|nr:hypothetical protein [Candidatus Kapabacteria bacterium]
MPRFLLITLIALQSIVGVAVGDTDAKRFYKTGNQVVVTQEYKTADDSTVIREFMTVGRVLPPVRTSALIEYTVVTNEYALPGGDLMRHDSCAFPVFTGLADSVAENKINGTMLGDACALWQAEDSTDIWRAIQSARQNDYYYTGYAVTNWDSALISVQLNTDYEGAYPNELPLYFNFSAVTGNVLTLDSIIAPEEMPRFQKMLRGKVKRILKKYRSDLAGQLRNGDIDSADYEYCMDAIQDNCLEYFNPLAFIVSPDTVEVALDCAFIHALQALAPESNIAFTREELKGILKKEYE